jgi:hypothetical protein
VAARRVVGRVAQHERRGGLAQFLGRQIQLSHFSGQTCKLQVLARQLGEPCICLDQQGLLGDAARHREQPESADARAQIDGAIDAPLTREADQQQ